jgi:hypothetical protein
MPVSEILSIIGSTFAIIAALWRLSIKIAKPFIRWAHDIETSTAKTLQQLAKLHEDVVKIITDHERRLTILENRKTSAERNRPRKPPN